MPTPAVAYLTRVERLRRRRRHLGVAQSVRGQRHQGVLRAAARSSPRSSSAQVEAIVADTSWDGRPAGDAGPVPRRTLVDAYLDAPARRAARRRRRSRGVRARHRLRQRRDDDGGAAAVPRASGFDVTVIGDAPDGRNINLRLRLDASRAARRASCVERRLPAGRGVRRRRRPRDLRRRARPRRRRRRRAADVRAPAEGAKDGCKGNAVVATVMSNIGLELALRESGIELVRCPVGDKYVMEEMLQRDLSLGGEQSGHIIFSDYLFTGDGLVHGAERAADRWRDTGRTLGRPGRRPDRRYPQVLLNVRVREKTRSADGARGRRRRWTASRRGSPATAACSCATPAPSRCCASCSKGTDERGDPRLGRGDRADVVDSEHLA